MGQDKSEIPKKQGSSQFLDPSSFLAQGNGLNGTANGSSGKLDMDNPVSQWLMGEAKQRLSETLLKLGLDAQKINGKHLASYSADELALEKKKVKNELKIYDQAFIFKFQRVPQRAEKEPMRQIYMYYKRLKQYIQRSAANGSSSSTGQNLARRPSADISNGASQLGLQDQQQQQAVRRSNSAANSATDNSIISKGGQPSSLGAVSSSGSRLGSVGQIFTQSDQEELEGPSQRFRGAGLGGAKSLEVDIQEEDKIAVLISQKNRGGSEVTIDARQRILLEHQTLLRKYNVKTASEVHKKYLEMKSERRELRTKLDKFQKDFEAANNRKIRYTKDIAAVATDFKRYKDMKGELQKLEVLL